VRIIVQKFGGSSLATVAYREMVSARVLRAIEQGMTPVVVVSAMGRSGAPYATDTLLAMAKEAYPDPQPREIDLLMSCGEIISSVVMAGTLRKRGLPAVVLTGGQAGIVTDNRFGDARILRVQPDHLRRHIDRGDLCVVAGFQGLSETGDVTTLGRGGSDTTAAALAVALRAELLEIFTDVDGVKTADPAIVPEARTLRMVSYEEIFQLAHQGARVVHPRAVELAMRGNVPVRVRSTFADPTEDQGTLITHAYEVSGEWPEAGRVVIGVAQTPKLVLCSVDDTGGGQDAVRIFAGLADAGIAVDLINVSPDRCRFVVSEDHAAQAQRILKEQGFAVQLRPDCAKVAVVGTGMRGLPGVMALVAQALEQEGIAILQTADSHVTISCLVSSQEMERAVQALHRKFALDRLG